MSRGHVASPRFASHAAALLLLYATCSPALTATAATDRLVPQDYPTVQAAVDAASNGDRVLIAEGSYRGSVTVVNKSLTLRGAAWDSGLPLTQLTASGTVITLLGSGSHQVVLDNLLVRDATQGIYADGVNVVMNDCVLTHFANMGDNGGCYRQRFGSLIATRSTFSFGIAGYGGGLYIGFASAILTDCLIANNQASLQASGAFVQSGSLLRMEGCTVVSQSIDVCVNSTGEMMDSRLCNSSFAAACNGSTVVDLGGNSVIPDCVDCDADGVLDLLQIALHPAADLNSNGVVDTCECIADLTGNGEVNGADISVLLGFWGKVPEPLPAADINQDGNVDGLDLAVLLGNWGPCP